VVTQAKSKMLRSSGRVWDGHEVARPVLPKNGPDCILLTATMLGSKCSANWKTPNPSESEAAAPSLKWWSTPSTITVTSKGPSAGRTTVVPGTRRTSVPEPSAWISGAAANPSTRVSSSISTTAVNLLSASSFAHSDAAGETQPRAGLTLQMTSVPLETRLTGGLA
jgi:hypothetical protein